MVRNHGDPAAADAARALASKIAAAADVLIDAMLFRDTGVRSVAAFALGEIKVAGAVDVLVEALHDPAGPVRSSAAKSLGDIGDERQLPR